MAEPPVTPQRPSGRLGLIQTGGRRIGRQIKLPWSKALEISFKSVKARFWRSLITAAGIILAIAFLMATLTRNAVLEKMKVGVPGRIKEVRRSLSAEVLEGVRGRALGILETATKTAQQRDQDEGLAPGKPASRVGLLNKVRGAIRDQEFLAAGNLLEKAVKDRPDLGQLAEIGALEKELRPLVAKFDELARVEEVRLTMIRQGEAPMQDSASRTDAAPKTGSESRSRDLWLMALALIVALVGITNAVLMSVTERFREIGTMKCLGALDSFVVKLFLIESSLQGLLGTVVGVLLGLTLALAKLGLDFSALGFAFLPWVELLRAVGFAVVCGTGLAIGGALLPAYMAGRMEPVMAMRVDQ